MTKCKDLWGDSGETILEVTCIIQRRLQECCGHYKSFGGGGKYFSLDHSLSGVHKGYVFFPSLLSWSMYERTY